MRVKRISKKYILSSKIISLNNFLEKYFYSKIKTSTYFSQEVCNNTPMEKIKMYTDGSCLGNPGEGGWGAIIQYHDGSEYQEQILRGGEQHTTNNRMEMTGIISALNWIKKNIMKDGEEKKYLVEIFSDSRLIIDTMTKHWKKKMNTDLWAMMDDARHGLNITWNWVKGHSTDRMNQRVDKIAVEESTRLKRGR